MTKSTKNRRSKVRGSKQQKATASPNDEKSLLLAKLRPKRRVTVQKSIRFEKTVLGTALAFCWWKRTDLKLWAERALAEKILDEFAAGDVGFSQQEVVTKYREHIDSNLQKIGALAAVYDDPADE